MIHTQVSITILLSLMIILASVIMFMSMIRYIRVNYLLKSGVRAVGTIIDEIRAEGGNRYKLVYSYFPVVRYYTGEGEMFVSKSLISRRGDNNESPWEIGDEVELRYHPENPKQIIVHDCYYGKADNPKKMLIPFSIGILMFCSALSVLILNFI
jgi:hypothetical protein